MMNIRPVDILRAIAYPLTESTVVVALVFFWLMVSLASWGGILGLFLMFLVLPAVLRYQMILLDARARGVTPEVPGIEFFNWFGNSWTLFPVLIVVILVWATVAAGAKIGITGALVILSFTGVFFPASIAVLAITHSPLQSLNPVALAATMEKMCRDVLVGHAVPAGILVAVDHCRRPADDAGRSSAAVAVVFLFLAGRRSDRAVWP